MKSDNNSIPAPTGGGMSGVLNSAIFYSNPPLNSYIPYSLPPMPAVDINANAMCYPNVISNTLDMPGLMYFDPTTELLPPDMFKKCHLHTKPRLTCKYCRKYKSAVVTSKLLHHQARLTQQQENLRNIANQQPLIDFGETWVAIDIDMKSYLEIVNELCNYADHTEPYCAGSTRAPSTLFCGLYKLFTLRLKQHEVQSMLDFTDSPYVRCAGFLYLRFILSPEKLWDWFCPYFLDDDSFSPGVDKQKITTIGEYAERLMTEDRYFSTVLPRIPVKLKSHYGAQLMPMPAHRKRRLQNKANIDQFKPGVAVAACIRGEWIEGSLVSVEDPESGQAACQVQIDDDEDHIELVDLGLVIILTAKMRKLKRMQERQNRQFSTSRPPLIKRSKSMKKVKREKLEDKDSHIQKSRYRSQSFTRSSNLKSSYRSRSRSHSLRKVRRRSRSRSRSRSSLEKRDSSPFDSRSRRVKDRSSSPIELSGLTEQDMLKEFKRKEQAKALASGKDYARRPTSYKSSLSLRFSGSTAKPQRGHSPYVKTVYKPAPEKPKSIQTTPLPSIQEPSQEYQEKMAQLMKKYNK